LLYRTCYLLTVLDERRRLVVNGQLFGEWVPSWRLSVRRVVSSITRSAATVMMRLQLLLPCWWLARPSPLAR